MSTYVLSKPVTFMNWSLTKNGMFEDGKQLWSSWINRGIKDITPIADWEYAAQRNLARSIM